MAAKRILLVEGRDDEHVFKHLFDAHNLEKLDEVKNKEGKDGVLRSLLVELKGSDVEAIGVVLDADTDLQDRWAAVRDRLRKAGYLEVPDEPETAGTLVSPPPDTLLPRVGVWLMPNNKTPGILEDFLRFLAPVETPLFQHVETSVAAIPQDQRKFAEKDTSKAVIHTWLAWQEEPGKPFGQAIKARYLDPSVPEADVLVSWLQRLFFP